MPCPEPRPSRRRFLRRAAQAAAVTPFAVGGYAWRIEPHWVRTEHREMPIQHLPLPLENQVLAHISDLHVGPVVDEGYLRSALRRVRQAAPALVVVTGDWMTCEGEEQVEATLSTIQVLRPEKHPVIGILGNHDYGERFNNPRVAATLTDGLRRLGVEVLRNECTEYRGLQIAGSDDLWARRCDIPRTLSSLDRNRAAIALTHNPDAVDQPGWDGYRGWVLAGHTHGGQCWAPGIGAPVLPVENKRYAHGEVDLHDGRQLYVNRGLGYKAPVRLLSRPEISLFRMTRATAAT